MSRTLSSVLARHAARVRSRRTLLASLGRALLLALVAAVAAAPLAAGWAVGHARVDDYLGPHHVTFASNYRGEIAVDLGPLGGAYLPSPVRPVGVTITVRGVDSAAQTTASLFSPETLTAYTALFTEPREAVRGVVERLEQDAVVRGVRAEAVLLVVLALWRLRSMLLAPWVSRRVTRRRTVAVYLTMLALVGGSVLAPQQPAGRRIPLAVTQGTAYAALTVDSVLLADVLDRGIKGVTLLSGRQRAAVDAYVDQTSDHLVAQVSRLPRPATGETMLMGLSDLHCNQAMTQLLTRLAAATRPALVLSSGDDTVDGSAVERGCITRERQIAPEVPFVGASGNHDSDVTEAQMRAAGMVDLDGQVVAAADVQVLGDDDPEHNLPFSIERDRDRPETEEQMAERLVDVARGRRTDVILVHQPACATAIMRAPELPARLVLWGHFHSEAGPTVVTHADGSWTVGMREGTAGGVKEPIFTSFSTPFSPPLISGDVYFYFRDDATGLITGVQPVHFLPDSSVVVDRRIPTGDLARLSPETRGKLGAPTTPTPSPSPS